jgi:V8-like Glu-specific endopeptidase
MALPPNATFPVTTSPPYSSIVSIVDIFPNTPPGQFSHGSGVLVAPDEVLTAAHVVWNSQLGAASMIVVSPGETPNGSPFGAISALDVNYYPIDDGGEFLTVGEIQHDFALIHLSQPIGASTGIMHIGANVGSPTVGTAVHLTGYPQITAGPGLDNQMVDRAATVVKFPDLSILVAPPGTVAPGDSGAPVWLTDASGVATVIGITSAANSEATVAGQITTEIRDQINAWILEDHPSLAATSMAPTGQLSAPGAPDLTVIHGTDGHVSFFLTGNPDPVAVVGPEWVVLGFGNFDGHPGDIAIDRDNRDGTQTILTEDTDGHDVTNSHVFAVIGNEWHALALPRGSGDFNGDGKQDLIFTRLEGPSTQSFLYASATETQVLATIGREWTIRDTADFSHDHTDDLLISREDPGGAKTFFIEGVAHGRVETADIVAIVGGEWEFENTADFNQDGTADIGLVRDNHDGTHSHISYLVANGHVSGNTDIFFA